MVHSQEIKQPYFNINRGLLVSMQSSSRSCILFRYTRERDRERRCTPRCKHICLQYFSVFHRSLTKMTNGRKDAAGAHSIRFLVDLCVYEFQSFISLDSSEWSVFVQQSPYQLIARWSYRGIKFLTIGKEGKKERKQGRRKTILRFRPQAVLNSADPTASVKHCNSFGSGQEFLESIYISKTNL